MFKSVFAKYITTFMVIIFISFAVLVSIITGMVNSYAVASKERMLSNTAHGAAEFLGARAETLSANAMDQIVFASQADVDRMLAAFGNLDEDMSILLVNEDGKVVRMISADGEIAAGGARIPLSIMNEVNNLVELSEFQTLEGVFDRPHLFYTAPVFTENGYVCGTVFACSPSVTQDALLDVMIKTILISSLWVMLAALIFVYIITERVIAPLRNMSRMAGEFAAGNYDVRVPVKGKDEVAALAVAFNDMADSISRLEVMRNTFVANVSHDLRTPMTTISGFIDNILSGAIPPEKHKHYLEVCRAEVSRLARLVASLLDISRIQAGDRKFEFKPFDICEMARRILFSFEAKIDSKRLEVEFFCDEERMIAVGDHDAIYQILYNICDNAVKFSREGGVLRVRVTGVKDNHVQLSVYNEGEGIAADDLPFVFERFYKGDKSRGLDKSGVGLGLFISKTIMDAHHEKIWVTSEQGKFCEFNFTLPLA
ncbi:MAG: HAMP domain-containing histidine kinase [Ruminococcaceae bacterium]|nr:HAMP domain-containing histidine kinase [Oscillospiraceae bacterium]